MKRRKGPGVGNGVDSGCSVGNGVDRGRGDLVVDERGTMVQEPTTGTPHQLQPEREPTMAIVIAKYTGMPTPVVSRVPPIGPSQWEHVGRLRRYNK